MHVTMDNELYWAFGFALWFSIGDAIRRTYADEELAIFNYFTDGVEDELVREIIVWPFHVLFDVLGPMCFIALIILPRKE
jgi:hypothetical protein